ncbi:MAG: peptidyl-alpha-hydroxyglycine alpha-amidating lyase family protein [Dehalococcoidia bacterium]
MTTAARALGPVTTATKFEPAPYWAKLPMGVTFRGDATSVAVDSKDNVYVFNRGTHPVAVFDKEGNFIKGWGQGEFDRPHGIEIDAEDNLYLVDDGGHFVQKRTNDGKIVFTLGERGTPAPWQDGGMFNRPTDIAINPATGDLFVSDGYGNSRVHKFDASGKHIKSWGEPGTAPGQFSLPHNVCMLGTDKIVVCDRENFRLQVFTTDGEFVDQWHIHHPMSITHGRNGDTSLYVGEMGPPPVQNGVPNLGNRVTILSSEGEYLTYFGAPLPGQEPNQISAPHGIATDSEGSVYIGEVAWTFWFSRQPTPPLGEIVSLRKWQRVSG